MLPHTLVLRVLTFSGKNNAGGNLSQSIPESTTNRQILYKYSVLRKVFISLQVYSYTILEQTSTRFFVSHTTGCGGFMVVHTLQ